MDCVLQFFQRVPENRWSIENYSKFRYIIIKQNNSLKKNYEINIDLKILFIHNISVILYKNIVCMYYINRSILNYSIIFS